MRFLKYQEVNKYIEKRSTKCIQTDPPITSLFVNGTKLAEYLS